ncbi:hypothetical protein TWF730_002604 [Orbilia blumenaviensis]|uniref:Uncharacterized protein n=1 Tax=Orbilia blumenaviensis TaxID=1796055 RepID=A0AAV9UE41_9PEZI
MDRSLAENRIHRGQRDRGAALTDFDNPTFGRLDDHRAVNVAHRHTAWLNRNPAAPGGYFEGELTVPPGYPRRRGLMPGPRTPSPFDDPGFADHVQHSPPRSINYPPGSRHHLSGGYRAYHDPAVGRLGEPRAQPQPRSTYYPPENNRPSMAREDDSDPWDRLNGRRGGF